MVQVAPEPAALTLAPAVAPPQPVERPQGRIQLSEDSARRLAASRQSSALLGDVVSLLARSPKYKHHTLADLEWLVTPGLASGQFQIAEGLVTSSGARLPMGLVLWASVSQEVEARLRANAGKPQRLRPDEWKSGDTAWLLLAAGEPKAVQGLLRSLADKQFKDRTLWLEQQSASGAGVVSLNELLAVAQGAMAEQRPKPR